jgi:hypothetical protein
MNLTRPPKAGIEEVFLDLQMVCGIPALRGWAKIQPSLRDELLQFIQRLA